MELTSETATLAACYVAAVALAWAVYSIVYNRLIHPLRHVPGPFLATCFDVCYTYSFVRGMVPFDLLAMHEKYGPVVRLAPDRVSFVDYNDMRTIHATHAFPKHRTYRSFEWGQENMFSTNSAAFSKKRKRMLTPVFAPQSIARLEPLIFDVGIGATLRRMYTKCRRADSGTAVVDLYLLFFEMAFNTIGRLSFGESFDMVGDDDAANRASQNLIVGALKKLDYMLVAAALVPELVKNLWLQYVAPLRIVGASSFHDYAAQLVASRLTNLAAMQRDGADMCDKPVDILQLMIDTDDPDTGEKLGGRELVAEAMVTMFAGSDTAGNTLTFTFDMLFAFPRVMARLEAEVLAAFPDQTQRIVYRDAKEKLPYLEAVLLESMRIRTVGGGYSMREVPDGGRTVAGYFLPAGTAVAAPKHVMHNLSTNWDDPHSFIPERFLDGPPDVVAQRRLMVLPFSVGVRSCIGRHLAMVELTVALATMIQHYKIRPTVEPYTPVEPRYLFLMCPKGKHLDARITPRSLSAGNAFL